MSLTDDPDDIPEADPPPERPDDHAQSTVPTIATLRWPIVQALRDVGRASDAELVELVADSLKLTDQQRAEMIPSGQETSLRNRVSWAAHELKQIGAVYYPEPSVRALTALGNEIDDDQIKDLHRAFEAEERRRRKANKNLEQVPGPRAGEAAGLPKPGVDLSDLVEQFLSETGYPTEDHEEQKRLRAEWAEKLSPEKVASLSREDLLAYTSNAVDYGDYVTRREGLRQQWIDDLDEAQYDRLRDSIHDLCWGDDELSTRIDRLTDRVGGFNKDTGIKGFTGLQVSRSLAICHPEQFLPLPSQIGKWGREVVLRALGLPDVRSSYGQRVIDANNRLREHLAPYFETDTAGMVAFINWFKGKGRLPEGPVDLTELADELLIDVEFLEDIVSLLEDKGQVILYGPPGTGKTYLARALAKVLAPDEACRTLVQFHPSTSYEDFFEGYRPAKTGAGSILYELTPGPLKRMADKASDKADQCHVMIIDEINRGNLPRVLGELLFLLEYRDESVQTLYRPDEPFALPENLWFIGTMNTADRSIALVDAALRRRFHFVPFFPDSGPMAGLLGRWLDRKDEPAWIGRLVDAVNNELKEILEGSHLSLGPSHFMKEYGSSLDTQRERLRRIWEYNIEPFIEDQFFGDPEQINRFRFTAVMARRGPPADARSAAPADSDEPADPDLVLDPNESKDGDSRLWRSRADNWPPAERAISGSTRTEQNSVVGRYVAFALQQDKNPGSRDKALVDAFLASLNLADSSQRSYRSHLNQWFNHQHGPVEGKR